MTDISAHAGLPNEVSPPIRRSIIRLRVRNLIFHQLDEYHLYPAGLGYHSRGSSISALDFHSVSSFMAEEANTYVSCIVEKSYILTWPLRIRLSMDLVPIGTIWGNKVSF